MINSSHNRQKPLWHLLLALMLLQGVFVAFELGRELGHLIEGKDTVPWSMSLAQEPSYGSVDSIQTKKTQAPTLPQTDNCDHCCLCHGHGSHTAMLTNPAVPTFLTNKSGPLLGPQSFSSNHPHNIYRPPIV